MAAHAESEWHGAKAESLDEALKVSWMDVAAIETVVEKQELHLDSAAARIAELRNRLNEISVWTATNCEELLQWQKNLSMVLEKVEYISARSATMEKKRNIVTII